MILTGSEKVFSVHVFRPTPLSAPYQTKTYETLSLLCVFLMVQNVILLYIHCRLVFCCCFCFRRSKECLVAFKWVSIFTLHHYTNKLFVSKSKQNYSCSSIFIPNKIIRLHKRHSWAVTVFCCVHVENLLQQ